MHLAVCQSRDDEVFGIGALAREQNGLVQRVAQGNTHFASPACTCTYVYIHVHNYIVRYKIYSTKILHGIQFIQIFCFG